MSILDIDEITTQLDIYALLRDRGIAFNFNGLSKDLIEQLDATIRKKLEEKDLNIDVCVDKIYQGNKPAICIYTSTNLLQRNDALIANSANRLCLLNVTSFDDEKQDSSPLMQFLGLTPIKLGLKSFIDSFPKDKEYYAKFLLEMISQIIVEVAVAVFTK